MIRTVIDSLFANTVLMVSFLAWLIAQVLKVFFFMMKNHKFDIERLVGAGGMPSSHSALVVALCVSLSIEEGLNSPLVALAIIFACIVMYDAAGVRRAAGKQAKFLNELVREFLSGHAFNDTKFKELLGHTPLEVLLGGILGGLIAYGFYYW